MPVAEVELSRFLQQRTPRPLTEGVMGACLPRAPLTAAMGLVLISLTAMVALLSRYFPEGLVDDLSLDYGNTAVATGVVLGNQLVSRETGLPADGSDAGCVSRIDFRFSASDGEPLLGSSFAQHTPVRPNTPIDITYLVAQPSIARATGTTRSRTSRMGLASLLLPMPGLGLLLFVLNRRRGTRDLLTLGVNTRARVVDVVESTTALGLRRLCIALSFRDGRSTVIMMRAGLPETVATLERAARGETVPVLRDLRQPNRIILLDRLREDPRIPFEFEDGMDEYGRTMRPRFNTLSAPE